MDDYTVNHLIAWAQEHRTNAFEFVESVCNYMARLDKEDVAYMIERYTWQEIEGIVNR